MAGHRFGREMPIEETLYEEVGRKMFYWAVPSMKYSFRSRFPICQIKCDDKIREIGLTHGDQSGNLISISVQNFGAQKGPVADRNFEKENIVIKLRAVEEPKAINSQGVGSLKYLPETYPNFPETMTFEIVPAEGHSGVVSLKGFNVWLEITVLKKMKVVKRF
jgi:hypothetical protein